MIDIDLVELKKLKVSHVTRDYLKWFEQKSVKKFIQFKPNSLTELRNDVKKKINTKHSILFGIFMKNVNILEISIFTILIDLKVRHTLGYLLETQII